MTDTTFAASAAIPDTGSRRALFIAVGGVAALALAGGGYLLMSGGSSVTPVSSTVVPGVHHGVVPVSPARFAGKATKPVAKPVTVPPLAAAPIGRDPFKALYVVPVAAAPATGSTSTASGTTPAPTSTSTSSGGSSGTSSSSPPTGATYPLTLVSIEGSGTSEHLFHFDVAGSAKTVLPAQRFGKYGELVVLAWVKDSTGKAIGAVIQVGDADPFGIAIGEKISVQ